MGLVDQDGKPIGTGLQHFRIGSVVMPANGSAKTWQAMVPDPEVNAEVPISPLFICLWIATSMHLEAHQEEIVALKKRIDELEHRLGDDGTVVYEGDA